ncbi:PEP/pyruvate-binding domain-containing protein [Salisediminibacterium halotolerans]|uniref:Pyruvate, water dikinase n=1 Tax=Salisediminibacterium halotolerans TaxID=517425 RepID=A0A1H9VXS5_9BACI|nr:PEP/pyruvate-binding domain-containing protein [Salisediminibacterium haloalkalitolerans]SES26556.1 pyruvate, water dikinase [Salisediminibacterium haloalkalitolerans]
MIKNFSDRAETAIEEVGGKAKQLIRMTGADLPVPPGFVLTTSEYKQFLDSNGLSHWLEEKCRDLHEADTGEVERIASEIRTKILHGEFAEKMRERVLTAHEELGAEFVTARSSATSEDLPDMSFAGQHDSVLHLKTGEEVLNSIQQCWASLWNPHAVKYRLDRGMRHTANDPALAVVVQKMAESEKSGVLFTANIRNHRRDQWLVNASWGAGEAVVSGTVNPDEYIMDAASGAIVDKNIAEKKTAVVWRGGKKNVEDVEDHRRKESSLTRSDLNELYELAWKIEDEYNEPMDIEWVIGDEGLSLVQARPVTTLFPAVQPQDSREEKGARLYLSFHRISQGIAEPFTPLGLDVQRLEMQGALNVFGAGMPADLPYYKTAAGRIYWDITPVVKSKIRAERMAAAISQKDPKAEDLLREIYQRDGREWKNSTGSLTLNRQMARKSKELAGYFRQSLRHPEKAEARSRALAEEHLQLMEAKRRQASTVAEKWRWIEEMMAAAMHVIINQSMIFLPGFQAEERLRKRLLRWFGTDEGINPLIRHLPNSVTSQLGYQLLKIAQSLLAEGKQPEITDPRIKHLLEMHGHRSNMELDIGRPNWREQPEYLLDMVSAYMSMGAEEVNKKITEAEASDDAVQRLVIHVRNEIGAKAAVQTKKDAEKIRLLLGLRERPKFDFVRSLEKIRHELQAIGEAFEQTGKLSSAADVFYLTKEDLLNGEGNMDMLVKERRGELEKQQTWKTIPRFINDVGECFFEPETSSSQNALAGNPVSGGEYEGTVRVMDYPGKERLNPGEILVTHQTDPSWTPLFLTAGALIMETGGTGSHGGIVAREYGLPAVSGIENVSSVFQTGDRVRVNGYSGLVEKIDTPAPEV